MTTRPTPPHRLATTLTTLVVPALVLVATVVVAGRWAPRLPDPVAVHWGTDGPDGFGSARELVVLAVVITPLFAVGMWALAYFAGRDTSTRRLAAGFATGLAVFLSAVTLGSLAVQLDLADATQAPDIEGVLGIAAGAAVVAGALVSLLVPRTPRIATDAPVDTGAPRTTLAATERAAWARTVTSPAGAWVGGGALLLTAVLGLALQMPALLVVTAVLAVVMGANLVLRVSVDGRGLVARSPLGWPSLRVPLDEVVAARTVQVDPFGDFGGWGYRIGTDGRVGFVLRKGEGIEVERTGGRVNVVTVDDAQQAAALLNTLADRART